LSATAIENKSEVPVQIFQQSELMDENQILNEMKGELLEEFVYDMDVQGKHVTSLSYAGVKEAIRRRGKYETLDVHIDEDKDQYRCLVKVRDLIRQIDVLGASTCEKSKPFAYTLAVNKAERNAFRKLIPEKLIAAMVKEFLERRKARTVSVPITPAQDKAAERGTSSSPEGPVPAPESPSWHVPVTKDQLAPEQISQGVKQHAITSGTISQGMVNWLYLPDDACEVSAVPENPVPSWRGPIQTFLIGKFLEGEKKVHSQDLRFEYELQEDDNGLLHAILIRGKFTQGKVNEIINAVDWAFRHVNEPPLPGRRDVGSPVK
jgi:hypothetical protein